MTEMGVYCYLATPMKSSNKLRINSSLGMAHAFHNHLSLCANSYLSHNHTNDFNLSPLTPSFPDTMHNDPHFFLAFRNSNISAQMQRDMKILPDVKSLMSNFSAAVDPDSNAA